LRIAVGIANGSQNTLSRPSPVTLSGSEVRTSVAPAVACSNAASTFKCVVAYVDQADTLSRVKTLRFNVAAGTSQYNVAQDAGGPSTIHASTGRTASRIALWWHNDRWWIAFRGME